MKLILKIAAGIILAIVLLAVGCSALVASSVDEESLNEAQTALKALDEQPGVVHVVAPAGKCWSGAIGDSSKDGCGAANYPIENESIIVANAQKQDDGAWTLRMTLEIDGKIVDKSETTAQYGIVQVSE